MKPSRVVFLANSRVFLQTVTSLNWQSFVCTIMAAVVFELFVPSNEKRSYS